MLNSICFQFVVSQKCWSLSPGLQRPNFGFLKTQLHNDSATACTSLGFMVLFYWWQSSELSPSSALHSMFYSSFRLTGRCSTAWLAIPVLLEKNNAIQKFGISEVLNALEEPTYTFRWDLFAVTVALIAKSQLLIFILHFPIIETEV